MIQAQSRSGACLNVEEIWNGPLREVDFTVADGTTITRRVGDAYFELGGERGAAPVIFGKEDDEATTLGSLGLILPFKRRLILMRILLA